ncbi:MAG: phosphate acyltransferase PlsX [Oscillospiraceae bacterium]|nr:phosphate acyltransferase PlsX [Oscillospiraceae bacterium]
MKIIVDAMGGDNAPLEIVKGALQAAKARPNMEIVLVGREADVRAAAARCGASTLPGTVTVVNAAETIDMHDDPATAFKTKKDSSMTVGLNLLKEGKGDAFVSAGSTGALLSAGTLIVKRVRGIRRAAMAPLVPTAGRGLVLVDCGANAECTVEYLVQFAYLGSFYASKILNLERPRVGLLNIGTEDTKGDKLRLETYQALKEAGDAGRLNFIGNIEAKEAVKGGCDVVVADGFSGNVMLKTIEGVGSFLGKEIKGMFMRSLKTKIAALLVKSGLDAFKERLNPDTIGGTPMLGLRKPVIKAHGSSGARAIENAIYQAVAAAEADLAGQIEANIDFMKWDR